MSSLAWVDFDEAERQRAQRIIALFQERETRDELGLGAIRDSIADHLFPGTSTIQTRLRYMLFIPWLFRRLEAGHLSGDQARTEARKLEIRLVGSLKAGGEPVGIIGRDAGARLKRLPSSVCWGGLGSWGTVGARRGHLGALPSRPGTRDHLYALRGKPLAIFSDQASKFDASAVSELSSGAGVDWHRATPGKLPRTGAEALCVRLERECLGGRAGAGDLGD
jgi:Family of unknown function (DUF6361)